MKQDVYQDQEPFYKPNELAYLEDWVFHYNSHNDQWSAIPRDLYTEYWNDYQNDGILKSKNLNTLLELLHKSRGKKSIIEKLTSGKIK